MNGQSDPGSSGKTRVVYVTIVNVGTVENGGAIVCRQHIERLRSLDTVQLTVCLIGTRETNAAGERYLSELGIPCKSFEYGTGWLKPIFPLGRWPFSFEELASRSQSINEEIRDFATSNETDIFVLDYLFTALFVSSIFELSKRRVVVLTLNPEADFYENLRKLGRLHESCSRSPIAVRRLRLFENWVYRHASHVVALSPNDVPKNKGVSARVIRPAIEPKFLGWQYAARKEICFVGSIAHFPNWLAVQWLCSEFASHVAARNDKVRIQIIGAESKDVPADWRQPNVDFLGTASQELQERMLTCGLFIAPIENNYGSKIKILECLAYGTPLLATREALAGLDDYAGLPLISLDNPAGAAEAACRFLYDGEGLMGLSALEGQILAKLSVQSTEGWRQLVAQAMEEPPQKPVHWMLNIPALLWGRRLLKGRGKGEKVNLAKGNAPELALEGFQEPAILRGHPIRWTEGTGRIRIIGKGRSLPRKLRLECWDMPEEGLAKVTVKINRDVALTMENPGTCGTKTVLLPRQSGWGSLMIEIEGATANDLQQRGVPLSRLQVIW